MSESLYAVFLLGGMAILGIVIYLLKRLGKGKPLQFLFKDFRRKIFMTLCLGLLFFPLYFATVWMGAWLFRDSGDALFFTVYKNPVPYIYGGLWLFAILSLSIYLVRMFIKYLYLTRGKDL